ncbi:MAG: hypothetical protein AAF802_05420 [Planctomycetota bacterium]
MLTESTVSDPNLSSPTIEAEFPSGCAATSSDLRSKKEFRVWKRLCRAFMRCHRQPLNVALHCVTTPIGLFGVLAVSLFVHPSLMIGIASALVGCIALFVPLALAASSTVVIVMTAVAAWFFPIGWAWGLAALLASFAGQGFADWLTGERSFQNTYKQENSAWWRRRFENVVLLIPALITIAMRSRQSPFRLLVARNAVLTTKLVGDRQREDFERIVHWVCEKQPTVTSSTHWWKSDLTVESGEAFERLATDRQLLRTIESFHGPGFTVEPVHAMNEVYVTGPKKQHSSDSVFYMGHVDGPWAVFPGASLYRCMLAVNANHEVITHYPMSTPADADPETYRIEHGDAVAFDFNRELHYITRETHPEQTEPRINLKLHFVAFPTAVPWYGRLLSSLTVLYTVMTRELFLKTIVPDGWMAKLTTRWVLGWTRFFEWVVLRLGWGNLVYAALAFGVAALCRSWSVALVLLSFVHYCIYVGTLAERSKVSFGTFKRDAVFFKSLSTGMLLATYLMTLFSDGSGDAEWYKCVPVVLGFCFAMYAVAVSGSDRAFFSPQLGFVTPDRVRCFPFGTIPQPIILGSVVAIGAMLWVPSMRQQFGWLILGHLACYAIVFARVRWCSRRRVLS